MTRGNQTRLLLIFGAMGASAALVPAMLPLAASRLGILDFSLLSAVPLMFGGLFTGVLLAPILSLWLRLQLMIQFATVALSAGLFGLFFASSAQLFLIASAVLGLGFGVLEVSITAAFKAAGNAGAKQLTKLNLLFAASAMTAPVLLYAESSLLGSNLVLALVAAVALVLILGLGTIQASPGRARLGSSVRLWPLLLAAIFYVGAESILAGWSSTFVAELIMLDPAQAALGASGFWALIALGRWLSLLVTPRFISARFAPSFWSLLGAIALFTATLLPLTSWTLGLFALATVAAGPIYALLISLVLERTAADAASVTTALVILLGAAGGFLLPAAVQLDPGITQAALVAGSALFIASIGSLIGSKIQILETEGKPA